MTQCQIDQKRLANAWRVVFMLLASSIATAQKGGTSKSAFDWPTATPSMFYTPRQLDLLQSYLKKRNDPIWLEPVKSQILGKTIYFFSGYQETEIIRIRLDTPQVAHRIRPELNKLSVKNYTRRHDQWTWEMSLVHVTMQPSKTAGDTLIQIERSMRDEHEIKTIRKQLRFDPLRGQPNNVVWDVDVMGPIGKPHKATARR